MPTEAEKAKFLKIIDMLAESRLLMKRMELVCEQIEKEFRSAINEDAN